ncbi:TPA: PKD domain-containing protein [Bacillus toyonensis]|nr:PKD domain-containing protein [Bacillus toyonensis]
MNGPYCGRVNEEIQCHSDGTKSTEANSIHVYREEGTFTVELTVKFSRGKESKEKRIRIQYSKKPS